MKPHCRPLLYNVNAIMVNNINDVNEYIRFSARLNRYLQERYGEYYIGLQLYQDNCDKRSFTVIASYQERPGVEQAARAIGRVIDDIYNRYWGCRVVRTSVLSFVNSTRVIPPQIF